MDKLNTTIVFSAPIIIYLLSVWGNIPALIGTIVYMVWIFIGLDEAEYRAKKSDSADKHRVTKQNISEEIIS